jgi:hypothetical protein
MRTNTIILLCSFLTVAHASSPAPHKTAAPYICRPAGAAIAVDGLLDEPAWQHAETLAVRYVFKPKEYTVPPPDTTVRLLWDRDYLYVGFTCVDDDIWSFSSQADDSLWFGDVVELFIKPSRVTKNYYEFNIAPNGTLYDASYPSRGAGSFSRFKTWSSGARVATAVNGSDGNFEDYDQGYTVEVAIPWPAFLEGAPGAGGFWTFGAFRYDYSKSFDDPVLLMSIPGPLSRFHDYEEYQDIEFSNR